MSGERSFAEAFGRLDVDGLRNIVASPAAMAIASVHWEIRRPERPAPGRGGHLVLVTGHDPRTDSFTFHNPSGHTPAARTATLDAATFGSFYAARAIALVPTVHIP